MPCARGARRIMKLFRHSKNLSHRELRILSVFIALFVGSSLFFGAAAGASAAPWWTTQPSQYINPEGLANRYSPSANMPTSPLGYYPFPSPAYCHMNYESGSYEGNCIYHFPSGILSALSAVSGQGKLAIGLYGNHWGPCAGSPIGYGGFYQAGTSAALSAQYGTQITLDWACQPMQFANQYQACGDGWWQPHVDPLYNGSYVTDSLGNTYNSQSTGVAITDPEGPTYVDGRFGAAPSCTVSGGRGLWGGGSVSCSASTANIVGSATVTVNGAVGSTVNYNLYCSRNGTPTLNATVPVFVTPPPDPCPTAVGDASSEINGFRLDPNAAKRNISATQCITNTSGSTYFIPKPAKSTDFGNFVTAVSNGQVPGVSLFSR